jgi:hypothetical protein
MLYILTKSASILDPQQKKKKTKSTIKRIVTLNLVTNLYSLGSIFFQKKKTKSLLFILWFFSFIY